MAAQGQTIAKMEPRSSQSYIDAGADDLWGNLDLVVVPQVEAETSEGVVVRVDDDERYIFRLPRPSLRERLRIALRGTLPELEVEHHFVEYHDAQTNQAFVGQREAERHWVMQATKPYGGQIPPTPRQQIEQTKTLLEERPAPVGPGTIQMLKDFRKREGQITVKLPAGVKLSRDQRREVSAFVRRLAKGYKNAGEVLVPEPA